MEWGRMGCRLSKIKGNRTHIAILSFDLGEKTVCTGGLQE